MSRFGDTFGKYGPGGKGAMREVRKQKRTDAEERNAKTPDWRRRAVRLAEAAKVEAAEREQAGKRRRR